MSLNIRIENGEVKDVWDTPPDTRPGWKKAIEIRPAIIPNRQYYASHTFDLTKDPVEIIYGVIDISVESRKNQMKENAGFALTVLLREQANNPETFNPVALQAVKDATAPRQAVIEACTTHDELDALM